jgi:hypothetical protein
VQQAQEAAAEAEAQRLRDFRLEAQRASLSLSFSSASRSWSYSLASVGYRPANTCGWISLKPGRASVAGPALLGSFFSSVMVSPTLAAASSLMPADDEAHLAGLQASRFSLLGVNTPRCSIG